MIGGNWMRAESQARASGRRCGTRARLELGAKAPLEQVEDLAYELGAGEGYYTLGAQEAMCWHESMKLAAKVGA